MLSKKARVMLTNADVNTLSFGLGRVSNGSGTPMKEVAARVNTHPTNLYKIDFKKLDHSRKGVGGRPTVMTPQAVEMVDVETGTPINPH